jgi:hypothetical protein
LLGVAYADRVLAFLAAWLRPAADGIDCPNSTA